MLNRPDRSLAIIRLAALVALLVSAGSTLLIVGTDEMVDVLEVAADSRWGVVAFFVVFVVATVILVPGILAPYSPEPYLVSVSVSH